MMGAHELVHNVHSLAMQALLRGYGDACAKIASSAAHLIAAGEETLAVEAWVIEMNAGESELLTGHLAERLDTTRDKWLEHPPATLSQADAETIVTFVTEAAPWATVGVGGAFVRRAALRLAAS